MDTTRQGDDQTTQDPIKIHHPEEEENHETGASKMFRRVKAKAKKIKNSLTKQGQGPEHEQDHDVDEDDDDESDEQALKVHDAPVYESSAVKGGQTEPLSHAPDTYVPAPREITPPGTKVLPIASSDYTRPVEPEPLQEESYGHEAQSHPVREAPSPPFRVSDLSDREESREAHHEPMTRTFAPGEDEYIEGQRKDNIETPRRLEEELAAPGEGTEYLGDASSYKSKAHEGGGETAVPEIAESLGRMKVTDESHDQKSGLGFELEREPESGTGKDSPAARFGGESGAELGKDFRTRNFENDQKTELGIDQDSSTGFGGQSGTGIREDFPAKNHELDQKVESVIGKDMGFGGKPGTEQREDFLSKNHEFDQEIESGIVKDSPTRFDLSDQKTESGIDKDSETGFGGNPGDGLREDFLAEIQDFDHNILSGIEDTPGTERGEDVLVKSHEFDQKIESGIGKDSPTGFNGESGAELGKDFPTRSVELSDQNTESGIDKDSERRFGENPGAGLREDFPAKSHEFEQTIESGISKDTGFGENPGTEQRGDFLAKSHEFDQEIESGIGKDSPTGFDGESGAGLGEVYPARSHESGLTNDSGIGKDFQTRNDDVKVETELGRDLPSGTHDQLSPGDGFESQAAETRDEAQEPKPITYTEQIGSGTSFITDKAIAAKNAVASRLGYSGETTGGEQHESPVGEVAGTVAEKLTPVDEKDKETGSTVTTKFPISGVGSGAEETKQGEDKGKSARDYLAKKLTPGEEDKALSEVITKKLNLGGGKEKKTTTPKEVDATVERIPSDKISEEKEHSEVVTEEGKAGEGMVGKIKGAVTSWFGGATEEVKPKSPGSTEESSQSLGSTVR